MEDLPEQFRNMLLSCLEEGMQPPFILASVAVNGSTLTIKYVWSEAHEGFDAVPLAEHFEREGFQIPINIMIVDSRGEAVRVLIESGGVKYLH